MRIGFIGLGKLGLDCAEVIADKGYEVCGYDVCRVESSTVIVMSSIKDVVEHSDMVFIAVPTPHDSKYGGELPTSHLEPKDFDYSIVISVLNDIIKCDITNKKIVLISTVLPGTTRREFSKIIPSMVYNPYLIAMGSVKWDMVNPEMIIIGTTDGKVDTELVDFYKSIMENNPRYEMGSWEEAESIKIFYNTWISTKIALANMVLDVSNKLGHMNVDVVNNAIANSNQRIMSSKYMVAGGPDSGHCHPRDNLALRWLSRDLDLGYDLFSSIMVAREEQTKNIAKFTVENSGGLPIIIVGKAYKPGVPYTGGSGSLLVAHYFDEMGVDYNYLDAYTGDFVNDDVLNKPACYLLMQNASVTYSEVTDCNIKDNIISPVTGSVVIDIWRKMEENPNYKLIKYGDRV